MDKKTSYFVVFLLIVAAFLGGSTVAKIKYGWEQKGLEEQVGKGVPTVAAGPTLPPFTPKKSAKPEVKFFVMSFCPYGNQAEAGLEPVYQLLKGKIVWSPRYIVSRITQETVGQCKDNCSQRVGNEEAKKKCQEAIDAKQLTGMDADKCVQTYFPFKDVNDCIARTCNVLKVGSFESLHGQQELNQGVREICAYNQGNLDKWWKFVGLVNGKCNSNNADTCWKEPATEAGLDVNKITQCEKTQQKALLLKEIAEAEKYKASGSPTVYINDVLYNGGRAPEDYKKAICSSFENPPEECKTILGQESAGASGGCQ